MALSDRRSRLISLGNSVAMQSPNIPSRALPTVVPIAEHRGATVLIAGRI